MKRYAIWNKTDPVFTPIGEALTAEQWIERYPIAAFDSVTVICAYGEINGAFFGTLGQMVEMYAQQGCTFTDDMTAEEKIEAIEAFEDEREAQSKAAAKANAEAKAVNEEMTATSLASIASSLEYQNMLTLEDVEV